MSETSQEWRGWKYYCKHPKPQTGWQMLIHVLSCGRTPQELIDREECAAGCGCIWDATSPDYWRRHVTLEATPDV
jgi:hypothetical protein